MPGLIDLQYPMLSMDKKMIELSPNFKLTQKLWWILVALNIAFLLIGQTSAILLGRYYYAQNGSSTLLATLIQTAGFPILCIPLILIPANPDSSSSPEPVDKKYLALIYISLGVLIAGDNMLYSVGLLYLSASTYSLISATQLVFNAVFSYFLNSQKFTGLILNSVIVITGSACLLGWDGESDVPPGVSKVEYAIGFCCTVAASAVYALLLCLMQLAFQKVLKAHTFAVVMKMQIYTALVATAVSTAGLFASGQWRHLGSEMENFTSGPASYLMTLVWTGISWQICSLGVVGLIFLVSSLFSNVISTAALAVTPIASIIVFSDHMTGLKALALLLALWGFLTYTFQNYRDQRRANSSQTQTQTQGQIQTQTDIINNPKVSSYDV